MLSSSLARRCPPPALPPPPPPAPRPTSMRMRPWMLSRIWYREESFGLHFSAALEPWKVPSSDRHTLPSGKGAGPEWGGVA
jgi:hypothetical protein